MPGKITDSALKMQDIRLVGAKLLLLALNEATTENSVRLLCYKEVLDGALARVDLPRMYLSVNDQHYDYAEIAKTYDDMPQDERLSLFPVEEICRKTGITPEKYASDIDNKGNRRELFCKFRLIFEKSKAADVTGKACIPNPLLIEELISTLNQSSVLAYPSMLVSAASVTADKESAYLYPIDTFDYDTLGDKILKSESGAPIRHSVHMQCTDPNKISVYLHFFPTSWIGGLMSSHSRYDLSINEETQCIEYSNLYTHIALPAAANPIPDDKWLLPMPEHFLDTEKVNSAISEQDDFRHQLDNFPADYPQDQFIVSGTLDNISIRIQEMFSLHKPPKNNSIHIMQEYAEILELIERCEMLTKYSKTFTVKPKHRVAKLEDTHLAVESEKSDTESSIAGIAAPSTHEATDETHAKTSAAYRETSMIHEETDISHSETTTWWQHIGNNVRSAYTAVRDLFLYIVRFFQRVCSTVADCFHTPDDEDHFARDNTQTSSSEDSRTNDYSLLQEETSKSSIANRASDVPPKEHITPPKEEHLLDSVDISQVAQHSKSNLER